MGLLWGSIFGFMCTELVISSLMLVPWIPAKTWQKIFKSKILRAIGSQVYFFFGSLIIILCVLLLDSVRESVKYSSEEFDLAVNPKAEVQAHLKLFRAQRNIYISGFTLYLCLIIYRMSSLISTIASLAAQKEAAVRQAEGAAKAARAGLTKTNSSESEEIESLKEEIKKLQSDRDAMKSQSESLTKEYDRLLKEHEKLQKLSEGKGDKKSD